MWTAAACSRRLRVLGDRSRAGGPARDPAPVEDVAHRAERPVGELGELPQAATGGVLLDDEPLDLRLDSRSRTWGRRSGERRDRSVLLTRRVWHGRTLAARRCGRPPPGWVV